MRQSRLCSDLHLYLQKCCGASRTGMKQHEENISDFHLRQYHHTDFDFKRDRGRGVSMAHTERKRLTLTGMKEQDQMQVKKIGN